MPFLYTCSADLSHTFHSKLQEHSYPCPLRWLWLTHSNITQDPINCDSWGIYAGKNFIFSAIEIGTQTWVKCRKLWLLHFPFSFYSIKSFPRFESEYHLLSCKAVSSDEIQTQKNTTFLYTAIQCDFHFIPLLYQFLHWSFPVM